MPTNLTWYSGTVWPLAICLARILLNPKPPPKGASTGHVPAAQEVLRPGFVSCWSQRASENLYSECSWSVEVFKGRVRIKDLLPKHEPRTANCLCCWSCIQHKPFYKDFHLRDLRVLKSRRGPVLGYYHVLLVLNGSLADTLDIEVTLTVIISCH